MTLYGYSQTELNHAQNLRLHLVAYLNHQEEDQKAEMLIPEVFMNKKAARKRCRKVNNNKGRTHAAKFPLRLSPVDREQGQTVLYLVLFTEQPEDEPNAKFMTPETFMDRDSAARRVRDTENESDENIEARHYPLELYAHQLKARAG